MLLAILASGLDTVQQVQIRTLDDLQIGIVTS